MRVEILEEVEAELDELPAGEQAAMYRGFEKLGLLGERLSFPHQSQVKGGGSLRELRPKSGRSPWRAFYRRIGSAMVVAAVGPEANVDPRGFRRAVRTAELRLDRRAR